MALEIYNTLTRKKEVFIPITAGKVGLYVCGPTVYSHSHVGHGKSYITFDIVHRYLEFLGYQVNYVQNITDVGHNFDNDEDGEDKMQSQAGKEQRHPMAIAEEYTRSYYEDMARLNVLPPDIAPRATGHITEQIELTKELIAKGYAYEADGNVYFDVSKDKDYGKLSGRKAEDQEASGRVDVRTDKRSPNDFALWKKAEKGHIMRWPSPWGEGFPGWHLECSAMSMKYLGETFDIHGGGLENQFPHHECEIAQSESATGHPFVRYWMHNNMVNVDGKKMGKSAGNSSYLKDLFKLYDPLTLRFTILQSHYRGTTEFKPEAIAAADTGYQKLLATYARLQSKVGAAAPAGPLTDEERSNPIVAEFTEAMNDDFNTAVAIATLYKLAGETNSALTDSDGSGLPTLLRIWNALAGGVLGILPTGNASAKNDISDGLMQLIIGWRKEARANRDFKMSDAIRDQLAAIGVQLEDSKDGTTGWKVG